MIFDSNKNYTLYNGNSKQILPTLPENSVDSIVTDPPYELGFMGKSWDSTGIANDVDLWKEVLRVLKPGGHLLAFSGSRTYHRMVVAIEDAGFEIRDQIMWVYGSGFPKSLDIGKAIQKASGVEPIGFKENKDGVFYGTGSGGQYNATPRQLFMPPLEGEAVEWQGWGTALKPAHEPIVLARKPFAGTVANNVLANGVGGLNIDGTRIGTEGGTKRSGESTHISPSGAFTTGHQIAELNTGRWPANFIHDGSDEVVELFPDTNSGSFQKSKRKRKGFMLSGSENNVQEANAPDNYGDSGSAARFFYCAKTNKRDRNEGLLANNHPTVKPTSLMQYLCKLITPLGGTILDPFMGSGSTGKAAMYENFNFVGIEMTQEYLPIAKARIDFAINNKQNDLGGSE
jgi:DNA modification methylase